MTVTAELPTREGHPVARVAAALAGSHGSVAEVARRCDLTVEQARTALSVLESVGRAQRVPLVVAGCAATACSSCPIQGGCGTFADRGALVTWALRRQ